MAIDGPAGAGKSTVASALAAALGWAYLDTGAMYRAVALAALERSHPLDDAEGVAGIAGRLHIELDGARVRVDGVDVTDRVRGDDVTRAASAVAAHPQVRAVLVRLQREVIERGDAVLEGRDIGTHVAPRADVKVFLTAPLEVRARRRCLQRGLPCDAETVARVAEALAARDEADAARAASPLSTPPDALVIDTAGMDVDAVVARIVDEVRRSREP